MWSVCSNNDCGSGCGGGSDDDGGGNGDAGTIICLGWHLDDTITSFV